MMELILQFFASLARDALIEVFELFDGMMEFDLSAFLEKFPVASTFYTMFQALGVGLVLTIAVIQLFKYFTAGTLSRVTEHPMTILLRAFFAVFLIFMGNYVLNFAFDLTKGIYIDFASKLSTGSSFPGALLNAAGDAWEQGTTWYQLVGEMIITGFSGVGAVGLLFTLVLCVCLIVQFCKMMLEIIERYIILCLLIFSSPLAWATFTSDASSTILKKWISMFIAQCVLMILSVWGAVMFLSVLANPNIDLVTSTVYAYAITKIVRRFDNYLQHLNLNAAGVGGMSLLDSIAATAGGLFMAKGRLFGGSGGAGGKGGGVLSMKKLAQSSPLAQGILGAAAAEKGTRTKAFLKSAATAMPIGHLISGVKQGNAVKKATGSVGAGAAAAIHPNRDKPTAVAEAKAKAQMQDHMNALKAVQKSRDTFDPNTGNRINAYSPSSHGMAVAEAMRFIDGAKDLSDDNKKILDNAIAKSFEGVAPHDAASAAEKAMMRLADEGGVTYTGNGAEALMNSYAAGNDGTYNAITKGADGDAKTTSATISISGNSDTMKDDYSMDYSASIKKSDGQLYQVSASNEYGKLVRTVEPDKKNPQAQPERKPVKGAKECTNGTNTKFYIKYGPSGKTDKKS